MMNEPITTATSSRATSPRQAYEDGMPLHIVRRRFHLSDSEAQDVAPEEFDDRHTGAGQNKVSGY